MMKSLLDQKLLTKFLHKIPFDKIQVGSSILIGYEKANCAIQWQVHEANEKGDKEFKFIRHADLRYYEIKRVR